MPGQPILRKLIADVEALGGMDVLYERIANGETTYKMAEQLGVSRPFLSALLNKTPERKAAMRAALAARADYHAEKALQLVDDVAADPNAIAKVREQVGVRKWLAASDNPEKYGSKAGTVQVNITTLHLDALRQVSATIPAPEVVEGSAEEVDDV